MAYLETLFINPYILGVCSVIVAFLLSIRMYPVIIYLARKKNLMDEPENRSTHEHKTPTLGGIGLFITFSLSIILMALVASLVQLELIKLLALLAATIILLFLGIKDDLLVLSPRKKISGQLVASCIVIFLADVRIDNLFGILGIGELPYLASVLLTLFVFIFIINAFNLIDGIDGLAGAIAIISNVALGFFFLMNDHYLMVAVTFIMIGALSGFLLYNLSDTQKIFMGDSGSMFIGFLLAFEAIYYLGMEETPAALISPKAPIIVLAIFSFPIVDTLRVFILRLYNKQNPFTADRNHIHHGLLRLGINHKQATMLVALSTVFNIELAIIVSGLYINVQLYILVLAYPLICLFPLHLARSRGLNAPLANPFEIQDTEVHGAVQYNGQALQIEREAKGKPVVPGIGHRAQNFYLSAIRNEKKQVKKSSPSNDRDTDLGLMENLPTS